MSPGIPALIYFIFFPCSSPPTPWPLSSSCTISITNFRGDRSSWCWPWGGAPVVSCCPTPGQTIRQWQGSLFRSSAAGLHSKWDIPGVPRPCKIRNVSPISIWDIIRGAIIANIPPNKVVSFYGYWGHEMVWQWASRSHLRQGGARVGSVPRYSPLQVSGPPQLCPFFLTSYWHARFSNNKLKNTQEDQRLSVHKCLPCPLLPFSLIKTEFIKHKP